MIIAVGITVLKTTQANTECKGLITNPNQSVGDKSTVILFQVGVITVFDL